MSDDRPSVPVEEWLGALETLTIEERARALERVARALLAEREVYTLALDQVIASRRALPGLAASARLLGPRVALRALLRT